MTPQQKRIVCPIIDQCGERVGVHHALPEELLYVQAYVDESGTVWTPPTAYAYAMVCKARDRHGETLERVWDAYGFDPSIDSSIWQDVLRTLGKAPASGMQLREDAQAAETEGLQPAPEGGRPNTATETMKQGEGDA